MHIAQTLPESVATRGDPGVLQARVSLIEANQISEKYKVCVSPTLLFCSVRVRAKRRCRYGKAHAARVLARADRYGRGGEGKCDAQGATQHGSKGYRPALTVHQRNFKSLERFLRCLRHRCPRNRPSFSHCRGSASDATALALQTVVKEVSVVDEERRSLEIEDLKAHAPTLTTAAE